MSSPRGRAFLTSVIVAALAALLAPSQVEAGGELELAVRSGRADVVSGGDALVELVLPAGVALGDVRVDADGRDVTAAFAERAEGRILGVVEGLTLGENT